MDLPAVIEAYEGLDNYRVEDFPEYAGLQTCSIYFSSNGLFFPNSDEVARRAIWNDARFEWTQLAPKRVARRIFVRDVRKQWYVDGISSRCPDLDALARLLEPLIAGFEVVCIGSSAGGYAAVLMGCLLDGAHAVCISGQIDLRLVLETPDDLALNPPLAAYLARGKYPDLSEQIRTNPVPIYFLYADGDPMDQAQTRVAASFRSIRLLAFKSRVDGSTCWNSCLPTLLGLSTTRLESLAMQYSGATIGPWRFSVVLDGWQITAIRLFRLLRVGRRIKAGRARWQRRRRRPRESTAQDLTSRESD